jgi:hypothetical protein
VQEEQAPWFGLAVGVLLCFAGAVLFNQRAKLAAWQQASTDARIIALVGAGCFGGGALLVAFTMIGLNWSRTPWAAAARTSFNQAIASTVAAPQFSSALDTFAREKRGPYGYSVEDVTFEPTSDVAACNPQSPGCSSTDPKAPIQQWQGEIHWQERRSPAERWTVRSCSGLVTLTRAGGWTIEGSRWCDLLPK